MSIEKPDIEQYSGNARMLALEELHTPEVVVTGR